MSDDKKKIFVDGLFSNEVADTAPEWVLGKGSINISKLGKFLAENANYAVNGYLDYTILRSKEGNRYVELDLYKFNNPKTGDTSARNQRYTEPLPIVDNETPAQPELDVSDVPF